ncbi:MAG: class I SAM-dependent DNA methyltransferase [Blautia sp.]|nr:class I SAM-dependent DNA methyltransferase [Blautia sp.]
MENEILRLLTHGQIQFGYEGFSPIKVSISQFYGIEINDFAVTVARTALWIAENQMLKETEDIVHMQLDFLPLKTNAYIVEGNALRIDWNDVVDKSKLSYIMGNPPFVGTKLMNKEQKKDTKAVIGKWESYGVLDYVACWYAIAASFIHGTRIKCAFVSTNSICQGEQVAVLWKPIFDMGSKIDFAYRTFQWDSEASIKAHVHCVIVGFSETKNQHKFIVDGNSRTEAENINPYLADAATVFITSARNPICDVPQMFLGCDYKDGDYYIFTEEEKDEFLNNEPQAESLFRPYMTGRDFINRKPRYCLWFEEADPNVVKNSPMVKERIQKVREFREASSSSDTGRYAEFPMRPARLRYYSEKREKPALALPRISSQTRRYVPMEILSPDVIGGASMLMVPDADLYTFGILTSNVHMSWMRTVCGRMKSDYRYSNGVVYNTFPWPEASATQRTKIEATAQGILDARAAYPDTTLAVLYDPDSMPDTLRKAHIANDRAVMQAYGMPIKETDEAACVAWLMKLYQEKIGEARL